MLCPAFDNHRIHAKQIPYVKVLMYGSAMLCMHNWALRVLNLVDPRTKLRNARNIEFNANLWSIR